MYYNCVKFHKTPISRLGGVALTRYMDGFLYAPSQTLFARGGGIIINIRKYRKALKLDDKVKVINRCDRWWKKLLGCGSVGEEKGVGRTQIMNIL